MRESLNKKVQNKTRNLSPANVPDGEVLIGEKLNDYEDKSRQKQAYKTIDVTTGEQHILSRTSLTRRMIKQKRPATCKPGRK